MCCGLHLGVRDSCDLLSLTKTHCRKAEHVERETRTLLSSCSAPAPAEIHQHCPLALSGTLSASSQPLRPDHMALKHLHSPNSIISQELP